MSSDQPSRPVTRVELEFPVRSYETGSDGAVRLSSLADYLQEAAGHHARVLGVSMDRLFEHDLAWVLRRLRIEVGTLPPRGSVVKVATWPTRFDRLVAERHFVATASSPGETDMEAGSPFLRSVSEWVIVNLVSRRVVRIPDFVRELRPECDERAGELSRRIAGQSRGSAAESRDELLARESFAARRSSLDIVGHVNNTQYIEWITDSLPSSWLEKERLVGFEIQFLKETRLGEAVQVETSSLESEDGEGEPRLLAHKVLAGPQSEATVRAVAQTEWVASTNRAEK